MNHSSIHLDPTDTRPILIVPYMWIGDFVRGHTVVRVLNERWPNRPVDVLTTPLCAPLVDYMPGVRAGILADLPRGRLAVARQRALAAELRHRGYGTALVLPRTWKAAIAPALAGIPERVGFVGEWRFGLINELRWGEKALPRFIDKNAALALPDGVKGELIYLALPVQREGLNEFDYEGAEADGLSRFQATQEDVRDNTSATDEPATIQVGRLRLRLVRAKEAGDAYALLGVAMVADRRSDGQVVLERSYIAPQVTLDATQQLSGSATLLHGLIRQRAQALAGRMGQLATASRSWPTS